MYNAYVNPWRQMDRVLRDLNGLLGSESKGRGSAYPAVNAWSNEDGIVMTAELPGVDPASVQVTVQENVVTIAGELPKRERKEGESWHRNERPSGRFQREFRLPYRIDPATVSAESRHGILTVNLHRLAEDKPRAVTVKVA